MTDHAPTAAADASVAELTMVARAAALRLARSSRAERAEWLRAIADALDAETASLVASADAETALGEPRLRGEVGRTTGQLRLFSDVIVEGSYLEVTIDHATDAAPDLRRMLQPLGPVAVFSASNFPFAFSVAGGDTASALAAGCPVVVKAHPGHPETSVATAEIIAGALADVGAPGGAFALVHGVEAGRGLVLDPAITAVGFTGSLKGGRALFELATSRSDPIPFYGELGSLNPVVITRAAARARGEQLAADLVASFTLGTGQFCTKPGVVFVPRGGDIAAALEGSLVGVAAGRMLNDRIRDEFGEGLSRMVANEATSVVAGSPPSPGDATVTPVVLQTSVAELLVAADDLLTECFGPVTLLVDYRDEEELEQALEMMPGALAVAVHAEPDEHERLGPLVQRLQRLAGRVIFDGWPTGVAVSWAQHHGGPWPATTAPLHTSVGATAIRRFLRPVAYQGVPQVLLPEVLRDDATGVPRRIDGRLVA